MESGLNRPTAAPGPRYKWHVVFMLWFICFFNYADRQAIFSVFPKLKEEYGFDKFQLGLIGSAFMWVYAGFAPFAGWIGDRFRRKDLILGGLFFWSLVTVTTGWCRQLSHFVIVRAAEGFGEAFYFPASMSLISDYHSRATRSRAMAFHQSSVYIGTIAGGALGGYFAEHMGWRYGFYTFGCGGMILAAVLYAFLREPRRGDAELAETAAAAPKPETSPQPDHRPKVFVAGSLMSVLREVFRTPSAYLLMAAFVGANFVAMTFLTWMPTFLGEKFGLKLAVAGLAGTLFIQVASAIGAPIGGILADKFSLRHPGGRMIVQAAGLIIGSIFVFLTATTRDVKALMVWMTLFGFCKGLYDANIFASICDVVHPNARASAVGVMNAVGWTGGALAPVTIGWLLVRGGTAHEMENMSTVIAFGAGIYLVAATMLLITGLVFARRDVARAW